MSIVVPRAAISKIAAAADPKQAIIDAVGNINGVFIPGDRVLLGTYIRPEKTKGGLIRPDSNIEEDVWQGKVGLILAFGTKAFKDTADYKFDGDVPNLHTWATYFVGSAKPVTINGCPCRLVRDVDLELFINDPNIVF